MKILLSLCALAITLLLAFSPDAPADPPETLAESSDGGGKQGGNG